MRKKYMTVMAFVCANLLVFFLLFYPGIKEYETLEQTWKTKNIQYFRLKEMEKEMGGYRDSIPLYTKSEDIYKQNINENFKSGDIKIFLHNLARQLNIMDLFPEELKQRKSSIEGTEAIGSAFYRIKALLTYEQIIKFLEGLTASPGFFIVKSLVIKADTNKDTHLNVEMLVEFCYFSGTQNKIRGND